MRHVVWIALCVVGTGCSAVARVALVRQTVKLDDGRFSGPVEVKVPRRADHGGHDFEVRVRMVARCDPLLTLAFPNGEHEPLGVNAPDWQALLRARAGVVEQTAPAGPPAPPPPPERVAPEVPGPAQPPAMAPVTVPSPAPEPEWASPPASPPPPRPAPPEWAPSPPPPHASAAIDAQVVIPGAVSGRWEQRFQEQWPGQLRFEAERARRCGAVRTFTATQRHAFDDTNTVAVWAEVPQELEGAELAVEVDELVPRTEPAPGEAAREEAPTVAPRPPQPSPKVERPEPPKVAGARWQPGSWVWHEGGGEWVWEPGSWLEPEVQPALRVESTGAPPLPGCRWRTGRWAWVQTEGSWEWVPGRWLPPPPLDEPRLDQPDPTAKWISGDWVEVNDTFRWKRGRWGRPQPRVETRPAPPTPSAQWVSGLWVMIAGRWVWSPGFWAGTEKPPPPKVEVIPPRPRADAVWLAGFWRWEATRRVHEWVDGHWELPPGEGFVWVEEKGPDLILRGRWELKVQP
jgi:hypothetical protein